MKLVKKDFAERLFGVAPEGVTKVQCTEAVDALLNVMTNKLCDGFPVRIQGLGKLVPYFKKGGRMVRNPRTGETMPMEDRYVVSFVTQSNAKILARTEKPTLSLWDLITELSEDKNMRKNYSSYRSVIDTRAKLLKLSELTVRTFNDAVIEARSECRTIELRGFGVFKTTVTKHKTKRNPRTGEVTELKGERCLRTVFKEGEPLKQALNS